MKMLNAHLDYQGLEKSIFYFIERLAALSNVYNEVSFVETIGNVDHHVYFVKSY